MTELQRTLLGNVAKGESARTKYLSLLEAYLHGTQYDGLPRSWDEAIDEQGHPVSFRQRRPSVIVPLPAIIVDSFTRALWASGRRPTAVLRDGTPEENAKLAEVIAESQLYKAMREVTRRALAVGTGLLVWKVTDGRICVEAWDAKHAKPTFAPGSRKLTSLEYVFKYDREVSDDGQTRVASYWHREVLTDSEWKVYEDVEAGPADPVWHENTALSVAHGLGVVPATWLAIGGRGQYEYDGTSIYASLLSLFDDINATASQQARAQHYALDPQTVLIGVAEADVQQLQKGGSSVWPLGPGCDAKLLESNGTYIDQAAARIEALRKWALDACGCVIPDPEKTKGAHSGTALELLSGPMLATVDDLREELGACGMVPLLEQILRAQGNPKARVTLHWGSLTPSTPGEAKDAALAAAQAVDLGLISKASAARFLAPHFGVTDPGQDQATLAGERMALEGQLKAAQRMLGEGAMGTDLIQLANQLGPSADLAAIEANRASTLRKPEAV